MHHAFSIQDKHAPQTNALFLNQNTIVPRNPVICIAQQRNINLAKSSILPRYILPVPERLLGIYGYEHNTAVPVSKLVETVLEGDELGGADEVEGCGDEEDD